MWARSFHTQTCVLPHLYQSVRNLVDYRYVNSTGSHAMVLYGSTQNLMDKTKTLQLFSQNVSRSHPQVCSLYIDCKLQWSRISSQPTIDETITTLIAQRYETQYRAKLLPCDEMYNEVDRIVNTLARDDKFLCLVVDQVDYIYRQSRFSLRKILKELSLLADSNSGGILLIISGYTHLLPVLLSGPNSETQTLNTEFPLLSQSFDLNISKIYPIYWP
jgi:hypothetical protein